MGDSRCNELVNGGYKLDYCLGGTALYITHMDIWRFPGMGGTPLSLDGFIRENPNPKWMINRGTPMTQETSIFHPTSGGIPM